MCGVQLIQTKTDIQSESVGGIVGIELFVSGYQREIRQVGKKWWNGSEHCKKVDIPVSTRQGVSTRAPHCLS